MHVSSCLPVCAHRFLQVAGLFGVFTLGNSAAFGATLVSYQFPSGSSSPTTTLSGVTASSVTSTIGVLGTDSGFSASGQNAFVRATNTTSTETDAFNSGGYFQFSLTPDASMEVDFTQFALNFGNAINVPNNYTASFFLRSSLDNYGTNIPIVSTTGSTTFSGGVASRFTSSNTTSTPDVVTFSLAGTSFQNITSNVIFRLYTFDNSVSSQAIARFDTFTLSGDVAAVPEPSAGMLVALAVGGFVMIRRSTRKRGSALWLKP